MAQPRPNIAPTLPQKRFRASPFYEALRWISLAKYGAPPCIVVFRTSDPSALKSLLFLQDLCSGSLQSRAPSLHVL